MPLMKTFSRPEISGWNPAPSSISAEMRPSTRDRALVGPRDAGDALEQRRLAGPVAADDAVGAALRHAEGHAAQRREGLVRLQVANQAALEQRRLQRGELLLPRIAAVDLRDVDDFDGGGHVSYESQSSELRDFALNVCLCALTSCGRPCHTSSAKQSRSRSNTK